MIVTDLCSESQDLIYLSHYTKSKVNNNDDATLIMCE